MSAALDAPSPATLCRRLVDRASQPYRAAGRFAYHFARGKLAGDPVFRGLLERGLLPSEGRILDLGCGQGLLAAWLLAARQLYDEGGWPAHWVAPPRRMDILGIDRSARDVARARLALGGAARFEQGDMRQMDFGQADVVVILDALHYVDGRAQDDILCRARAALPPAGLLLARVGDAGAGLGFHASTWIDRTVAFCRGDGLARLHGRHLADWVQALQGVGFQVEVSPMHAGLPFPNVMLVARPGEGAGQAPRRGPMRTTGPQP